MHALREIDNLDEKIVYFEQCILFQSLFHDIYIGKVGNYFHKVPGQFLQLLE